MQTIQIDTLLTAKDLAELLCISVRNVWKQVATGQLPRPIKIGPRSPRWKASVIQEYLDNLDNAQAA